VAAAVNAGQSLRLVLIGDAASVPGPFVTSVGEGFERSGLILETFDRFCS
jgi:hypothetical protein